MEAGEIVYVVSDKKVTAGTLLSIKDDGLAVDIGRSLAYRMARDVYATRAEALLGAAADAMKSAAAYRKSRNENQAKLEEYESMAHCFLWTYGAARGARRDGMSEDQIGTVE